MAFVVTRRFRKNSRGGAGLICGNVPYRNEQDWEVGSARIRKELGYKEPVDFTTALERTIAWERANPPQQVDPKQFDYAAEDAALAEMAAKPARP
jgi:hypothetical protein